MQHLDTVRDHTASVDKHRPSGFKQVRTNWTAMLSVPFISSKATEVVQSRLTVNKVKVYGSFIPFSFPLKADRNKCFSCSVYSYGVSIHKASQRSNFASQCRLNDHKFQEKDVQLSQISNPVANHFVNQSRELWFFFPPTIAFIRIPHCSDALTQKTTFWNTQSSNSDKVLLQIQEAIWTFYFYFFSFSWCHPCV